jgi:hypothetical protein
MPEEIATTPTAPSPPVRRRGRPPGARNRPRPPEALPTIKPAALRVKNAARYIDMSASFVRQQITRGVFESVLRGRVRLVLVASLDAWIAGRGR